MKLRSNDARRFGEPERPVARPPQRMAVDKLSAALAPWKERPGEGTVGQGGRTKQEWIKYNDGLIQGLSGYNNESDMVRYLVDKGFDSNEAIGTAQEALRDLQGGRRIEQLRSERMGVPNAAADELLNMVALLESGFTDVRHGPHKGTDILAVNPQGREIAIDAQMRTGRSNSWSIPVLGHAHSAQRLFAENPSARLGDVIADAIDENPRAWADKLLHDERLHREFFGSNLRGGKQKDALISTRRSPRSYDERRDNPGGRRQHGPFNPQRGDGMNIVDLGQLRNELIDTRVSDLVGMGVEPIGGMNGGGFRLSIPNREIVGLSNYAGQLNPEIVKRLSI